jgi:hypothetical protein
VAIRARFSAGNGREGVRAEWGIRSDEFWAEGDEGRGWGGLLYAMVVSL